MHMPMLYCGFLPWYGHQPRSTFLHLVETSGQPSTANPELIGYKVPQQTRMSTYLLHAVLLLRAAIRWAEADRHQSDCEMLH